MKYNQFSKEEKIKWKEYEIKEGLVQGEWKNKVILMEGSPGRKQIEWIE